MITTISLTTVIVEEKLKIVKAVKCETSYFTSMSMTEN